MSNRFVRGRDMGQSDIMSRALFLTGLLLMATGLIFWLILPYFDQWLFDQIRLNSGGWVILLTRLGGFWILAPTGVVITGLLLLRRRAAVAIWFFTTVAAGRLALEILKLVCLRDRPPMPVRLDLVASWSFPSAHAGNTTMTLLALALLLPRRRLSVSLAILAAITMAWTRIALGVHWPGDVVGGLGFGMLWVGIAAMWLPHETPATDEPSSPRLA
ncbi:MAG: phosphatase PAP2 family protein [Rhizorhabdus sp.]